MYTQGTALCSPGANAESGNFLVVLEVAKKGDRPICMVSPALASMVQRPYVGPVDTTILDALVPVALESAAFQSVVSELTGEDRRQVRRLRPRSR
ncbi:MAG: hypothetical protein COT81_01260 [Candidatus Buchananbacteria bacterium CG10_big_fil_rev_8_21_14_0_10_42_9]|uniref:Uncharacterized protein n=1 Tax=Candidatus Buchananbacteria bacterium CG10_big_fil_rev_8_21_14_0_10_42_9 TaxID=1974526 RepID=A0A2H0W200_9BACT|nr:MAG: hypothetical protein COT81_01260 [Candidatus Buchananbacteria bacterium CG10_big_fil_rev_8_21_14_0_10_42_9]